MTEHQFEVILDGGGPWGFRLQGGKDFGIPLNVSRVTPGSKAAYKQIVAGDIICKINGVDTEGLSHMEAQNHIKNAGSRLQLIVRKGKGISIADQNAIALGAAGSPKVMTQTDVIHSANVDHQFNPKPKPFAFSPSSTPAVQSTSPAKVAAPTSSVQAPKFDPGAYARKKKEELEQRKKAESNVAGDSDILKMINATSISKSPSPPTNSVGEDLPPPPPELIDDEEEPARASFGSSGPGAQSKTFKMLQNSIGSDEVHQSVFSRPSEDRNRAVPMPRKISPAAPQQTTVNAIPKPPMPSGPTFKATSPKAPTFNVNSSPKAPTFNVNSSPKPPTFNVSSSAKAPTFNSNPSPNGFKSSGASPSFKPSSSPQPASSPQVTTAKVPSQKAALPIDPSRTPRCHSCNEEIRGPFVSALGRTWHPEHFACNSCKVSLQNQGFVEEQDKLFCEKCYNSFLAPKCAACDQPIIGVGHGRKDLCRHCANVRSVGNELQPASLREVIVELKSEIQFYEKEEMRLKEEREVASKRLKTARWKQRELKQKIFVGEEKRDRLEDKIAIAEKRIDSISASLKSSLDRIDWIDTRKRGVEDQSAELELKIMQAKKWGQTIWRQLSEKLAERSQRHYHCNFVASEAEKVQAKIRSFEDHLEILKQKKEIILKHGVAKKSANMKNRAFIEQMEDDIKKSTERCSLANQHYVTLKLYKDNIIAETENIREMRRDTDDQLKGALRRMENRIINPNYRAQYYR